MNMFRAIFAPLLVGLMVSFTAVLPAQAGDATTEKMARILVELEKAPSDEARQTLENIAENVGSTTNEQTLAAIMLNIDDKIRPEDKPVAMKVMLNPAASPNERQIAKALLRFVGKSDASVRTVLSDVIEIQ